MGHIPTRCPTSDIVPSSNGSHVRSFWRTITRSIGPNGSCSPSAGSSSPIVAYLGTVRASAAAAEAGVIQQLERIRTEGATDDEVARARAYQLGVLAMDRRTNARHAWYLAFYEQAGVGWDFPDRYARALAAVN